jgi:hypothetical protein
MNRVTSGQWEHLGLLASMVFYEYSTMALQAWGNQACQFVPTVTCGAGSVIGGNMELQFPVCARRHLVVQAEIAQHLLWQEIRSVEL